MSDDYMKTYRDFWADLVETDGKLDLDKVARELSDYSFLMHEVPKVYDHVSGGMISKPNTHAFEVKAAHDQRRQEECDEAVKEATEELTAERDAALLQVRDLEQRTKDEASAYSSLAKSYEDMKRQNEAMRKALEEIRHHEFVGDSMSVSGITADKALKGLSEKRQEQAPKEWVPHIVKEGARFHVLSWDTHGERCSEENCERNRYRQGRGS